VNPFDDNQTSFYVVVSEATRRVSIWPNWLNVPAGWAAVGQACSRADCLRWIDHGGDIRISGNGNECKQT